MAQFLNPWSGRQFNDANGDPYAGAKLFSHVSSATGVGGSTKQPLTQDAAGNTSHENPIILNSKGEPANGAGVAKAMWQPSGVYVKLTLALASDTDPPTTPIATWDNLAGINDTVAAGIDQWVSGPTPTYVSATGFTLVGDQTTDFHVGRRLKTTNTAGTIYSTIITSAYTSLTTITVVNDSGVLDSGLSVVSYGLLTATNPSLSSDGFIPILGPDVASATALPYPAYGNYSDVTGTDAITSFDTSGEVGTVFKRHFDDALVLTHDDTNLVMPGGVNYTTEAGDELEFTEYASGKVRVSGYALASGKSIVLADDPRITLVQVTDNTDVTISSSDKAVKSFGTVVVPTKGIMEIIFTGRILDTSSALNDVALGLYDGSTHHYSQEDDGSAQDYEFLRVTSSGYKELTGAGGNIHGATARTSFSMKIDIEASGMATGSQTISAAMRSDGNATLKGATTVSRWYLIIHDFT